MKVSRFDLKQYYTTKAGLLRGAKDDLAALTKKLVKLEDLEGAAPCPDYEELEPIWELTTELTRQIDDLLSAVEPSLTACSIEDKRLKGAEETPLELPDMNNGSSLL